MFSFCFQRNLVSFSKWSDLIEDRTCHEVFFFIWRLVDDEATKETKNNYGTHHRVLPWWFFLVGKRKFGTEWMVDAFFYSFGLRFLEQIASATSWAVRTRATWCWRAASSPTAPSTRATRATDWSASSSASARPTARGPPPNRRAKKSVTFSFFVFAFSWFFFYYFFLGMGGGGPTALPVCAGYRILLGFTGFYWVLLGLTGFYWVLLGFTGFYWVLLDLSLVLS